MVRSIVVALSACIGLQWPATAPAAGYASLLTGREQARWAQFQPRWTQFLLRSLDATDERQRLVAAQMVIAQAGLPQQNAPARFSASDVARAEQVREAVRSTTTDAVTLSIAASHCKPALSDRCDRVALLERATRTDPANGWTWLALGGELARTDQDRAQRAFERALEAGTLRELDFVETMAALYVPLRRDHPDVEADLALVEIMGLAAAGVMTATSLAGTHCSAEAVASASRADACRRLAYALASQARTAIVLHTAYRIGQRTHIDALTLAGWQARVQSIEHARKKLPWIPIAAARETVLRWGDDLVEVGELEAAERLLKRP
jgi:hypothetical protein